MYIARGLSHEERVRGYWDALVENPQWRTLYLARSTSLLGAWFNTLAIVHLLGEGEVSAALPLAAVFVLKQLPVSMLGPAAGVLADRFDRRTLMVISDVGCAVVVAGFLLLEPGDSPWLIYGLTAIQVCLSAFFDPAYRAVIPDVVRPDDLVTANALSAATWSVMFAVGTAVGGLVVYAFGWKFAVAVDILSYLVSAALIFSVRDARTKPPARHKSAQRRWQTLIGLDDFTGGLAFLRDHSTIRATLLTKSTWGTLVGFGILYQTLLGVRPGFRLADSGDLGISFLWLCRAIGTGLGPPLVRRIAGDETPRLQRAVSLGFVLGLGSYGALSFATNVWVAGAILVVAHVGGATIWVTTTVLLQRAVPSEFRGRTFAMELGLYMLMASLSQLGYGALLDYSAIALPQTLQIAVGVCALLAIFWARSLKKTLAQSH